MNWNTENFSISREFARDIIWESRQKQEINNAGPAPPVLEIVKWWVLNKKFWDWVKSLAADCIGGLDQMTS